MAIKRVSDLDNTTALQSGDLFLVSKPSEGKSYKASYLTLFNSIKTGLDLSNQITNLIKTQIINKFPITNSSGSLVHYNSTLDTWSSFNPIVNSYWHLPHGGIDFSSAFGGLQLRWGEVTVSNNPAPTYSYATWNPSPLSAVTPAKIMTIQTTARSAAFTQTSGTIFTSAAVVLPDKSLIFKIPSNAMITITYLIVSSA